MFGQGRSTSPMKGVVARLALLLFVLRALVPVGFMPDLAGLADGRIEIVLCTPEGLKAVSFDKDGRPLPHDDSQKHDAVTGGDCPFGLAVGTALLAPDTAEAFVVAFATAVLARHPDDFRLGPPAHGPPLGPRAPPALLG